jgi:hypothetical protein
LEQVAEFKDHGHGHGRFAHSIVGDLLGDPVLQNSEVALGDVGNETALVVQDGDVHLDRVHVAAEGGRTLLGGVLSLAGELRGDLGLVGFAVG